MRFLHFYNLSLDFVIRLRKGQYKHHLSGNRSYQSLEKRAIKKGKASSIVVINDLEFRLWIVKNAIKDDKEPLIYILTTILDKQNTPDLYRLRWKIETLFKHLKTNGYNLEDLRMTDLNKIRLLISIVILAYIMAIITALEERKKEPIKKKTYKNSSSFDCISVFKQGQSLLKQSFISLIRFLDIMQFMNVTIKAPLPFNKQFVQ